MNQHTTHNQLLNKSLWIAAFFGMTATFTIFSLLFTPDSSRAASLSNFQAGNIMSDAVMSDKNSMTQAEIQAFLKSKNACNKKVSSESRVKATSSTQAYYKANPNIKYSIKNGYFACIANDKFGGESAAHIIYRAAQDYSINPQVLVVLLQKEQGLITDTWPNSIQYQSATGYGCPDTAPCNTQYYGLKNQVRLAAKLFRGVLDGGWSNYPVGVNRIQYNPNSSCGSSNVRIQNRATSALYRYTPYQPNKAALNAGWGEAPCGAYGNRNFWLYFNGWFGSTTKITSNTAQFIKCSGNNYLVDIATSRKRPLTPTAVAAMGLDDTRFSDGGYLCNLDTFDLGVNNLMRSRNTDKVYLIDNSNAYLAKRQSDLNVWGISININDTSAIPYINSKTILNNLKVTGYLPRLATSTNPDRSDVYLVNSGKRHTVSGTQAGDNSILNVVKGDGGMSVGKYSVDILQTVNARPDDMNYTFKVGGSWYLADGNNAYKLNTSRLNSWVDILTGNGPTLDSGVLDALNTSSAGAGFRWGQSYYNFKENHSLQYTSSKHVAAKWGVPTNTPSVSGALRSMIVSKSTATQKISEISGNVRLIQCGNDKYLVERFIRTKRPVSQSGIDAWGFNDKYFEQNDRGCSYPTYGLPADQLIRSRNTKKVYYIKNNIAYWVKNQTAANAKGFGNIADMQAYPQFNPQSIHDNLRVVRHLP